MNPKPLAAAISYATTASNISGAHEGEAWHLLIHFSGGNTAEVAVRLDPTSGTSVLERAREESTDTPPGEPIFVNPDLITHVEVLWI